MKIVPKFKNYCPVSVGSIDVRYDNKNPAELYPSTTWELLTAGKYIQSGNTALQVGGSNSINILKENLPNIKLQVETFNLNINKPNLYGRDDIGNAGTRTGIYASSNSSDSALAIRLRDNARTGNVSNALEMSTSTSSASPFTKNLGSGTAVNIQPSYITLKFWKRLT